MNRCTIFFNAKQVAALIFQDCLVVDATQCVCGLVVCFAVSSAPECRRIAAAEPAEIVANKFVCGGCATGSLRADD